MLFVLISIQTVLCYFSEIFAGTKYIPVDPITTAEELLFGKCYWYESKKWSYVFFLKQYQTKENQIEIMLLVFPFSKNLIRNGQKYIRKDAFRLLLKKLFTLNYNQFFKMFWLVRINCETDEYVSFKVFEGIVVVLKLSDNKVYSYSNFNLLEFIIEEPAFNSIDYGMKPFKKIIFFNETFFLIVADIGYIFYEENEKHNEGIIRKFFTESEVIWSKAAMVQNKIVLKRKPISEFDNITWVKTSAENDEFTIQLDSNKLSFFFRFKDKIMKTPKLQINETILFETDKKLKKMILAGMNVLELKLANLDVIHVITPKFVFEETWSVTHILFFVYYDRCFEENGEIKINYDYDKIFYSLNKSEISMQIKVVGEDSDVLTFKIVFQNEHIYFKTEVDLVGLTEEYEIPMVPDGTHSELNYAYTYLEQFLHWNINGAFADLRQEINKNKTNSDSEKYFKFTNKKIICFLFILSSFSLVAWTFFLYSFKKHVLKKKVNFQKR